MQSTSTAVCDDTWLIIASNRPNKLETQSAKLNFLGEGPFFYRNRKVNLKDFDFFYLFRKVTNYRSLLATSAKLPFPAKKI